MQICRDQITSAITQEPLIVSLWRLFVTTAERFLFDLHISISLDDLGLTKFKVNSQGNDLFTLTLKFLPFPYEIDHVTIALKP